MDQFCSKYNFGPTATNLPVLAAQDVFVFLSDFALSSLKGLESALFVHTFQIIFIFIYFLTGLKEIAVGNLRSQDNKEQELPIC